MEITKNQFNRYEECRKSGKTNMFMISNVLRLTGLDSDTVYYIMKHYTELNNKFVAQEETAP